MPIKDYLYFTKSQRTGIMALISLIIIVIGTNIYIDSLKTSSKELVSQEYQKEINNFYASLQEKKQKKQKRKWKNYTRNYTKQKKVNEKTKLQLFKFDPNTLDSIGLAQLGLKDWQISNIIKFRSKGGRFSKPEDFKKIYGLSENKYEQLKAYIEIKELAKNTKAQICIKTIDLNLTDSIELCQIKGIYPKLAKRIINYRNKLGGFVSKEQLKEVWGIKPKQIKSILAIANLETKNIKKLPINKLNVDGLRRHPYINFYQAKAIYEYRRNEGNIKSSTELSEIDPKYIDAEFIQKIIVYLDFESSF